MKANELRIGNLVFLSWEKEPEYKGYRRYEFSFDLIHSVKHLHPIPLTEEWLLKFGFQARYTIGHSAQYYINENPVTHDWMLSILWLEGDDCPFYKNGHHKIKYVHQLQNLYFALTGEELTYTQP